VQHATQVFFEHLKADVESHTKLVASSVRAALPPEVLLTLGPEHHKAMETAIRSQLNAVTWRFLCHFDNVGCHLPSEVQGYTILEASAGAAAEPRDIRVGDEDYADTWLRFTHENDA
jgi:hypothetical protein